MYFNGESSSKQLLTDMVSFVRVAIQFWGGIFNFKFNYDVDGTK